MTMGITMTLERTTDRAADLATIWAEVGASIEGFVGAGSAIRTRPTTSSPR